MSQPNSSTHNCLLSASAISKYFGAVVALEGVDLEVDVGEVVALVGDNGAGKSTLVKVLTGVYPPDTGEIQLGGQAVHFASPLDASAKGIVAIYQELALSENLSIYENVFLGREKTRRILGFPFLDHQAMRARVISLLNSLDTHISSPDLLVSALSGGQRQAVAICRALNLDARLVIMDEPTAALAVAETERVLKLIHQLRDQGKAILLVSHNLRDLVFSVADRIVVLRRGRKVGERFKAHTTLEEIVGLITGAVVEDGVRGE